MKKGKDYHINTKVIHESIQEDNLGSLVTPIYQTSTFRFKDADHGARLFAGEEKGYIYTRMLNPTVQALEHVVAKMEGGAYGLACASGMAATHTVLTHFLNAGDHIICNDAVYGATNTLIRTVLSKFKIDSTFVDGSNLKNIEAAVKPNTKLIFIETPGNPTLSLTDIEGASKIAHKNSAILVVDNTFMSPVLQNPLEWGADIIIHSMTKFLNGHADVVGGMIVVQDEETYIPLRKTLNQIGGILPPMEAFLVHRGIKTLPVRMARHSENASAIAALLEHHPKVAWVAYPGLKSFPQYALAQKQMKGPGGMISFELKGGLKAGKKLIDTVQVFILAVSLGGIESLIQHPASMTHATMGPEARKQAHITDGLVRISVGIEWIDDLLEDLESALEKI